MKRFVFLFMLLFYNTLFAQDWIGYVEKSKNVYLNQGIIKYFLDNIKDIESWQGKHKVTLAYSKIFRPGDPITFIDGYLYQYSITENFTTVNVKPLECSIIEFDFKKEEWKITDEKDDTKDERKAKDEKELKKKIKEKHEKLKKHKKPTVTPGIIRFFRKIF